MSEINHFLTLSSPHSISSARLDQDHHPLCDRDCDPPPQDKFSREDLQELLSRKDPAIYTHLLQQCGSAKALSAGRLIHSHIASSGKLALTRLANHVMIMYRQCGELEETLTIFNDLKTKNVYSWNIMLGAFADKLQIHHAKKIFDQMPERSIVSWNSMLAAYAQAGHLSAARGIFRAMPRHDVVTWNALASGYRDAGEPRGAVEVYLTMLLDGACRPDRVSFIGALDACGRAGNILCGESIHANAVEAGFALAVSVCTAAVDMYGKCRRADRATAVFDAAPYKSPILWTAMLAAHAAAGDVDAARYLFDGMPYERSVVPWTAMMAGYSQNGHGLDALRLFRTMDLEGVAPNRVTFITVLDACSLVPAFTPGRIVHGEILNRGIPLDVVLGTSLVGMYAQCGHLEYARDLFDSLPVRSLISWNCMISGYARGGHADQCLDLLQSMQIESAASPCRSTIISILFACSHGGALDRGLELWRSMEMDLAIDREFDHYVSLLDLLCRSGKMEFARDVLEGMPYEPDSIAWTTFLGSSSINSGD
ncbi:pentatricopeptide repeat-containing protein At2g21090 [Selaginella moellendorffii]|uniref:pentatricopeptide repeat-containing protein At2g21090 n=1 Tax=Selaginella moellendorffii TaxID=88036 RepID=UPI000D1C49F2|nr:pentatricopeptide repeat-containing protein At2g21090 [Selaginella moellendorffii]|eukprot:XP_024522690.1 pentatricopeptide repeat-containing protein At2g21090 [Selaginella moellendorffii]